MIAIDPGQGCCTCMSSHISELLDGELDEECAPRVALHLFTCRPCGRLAAELRAVLLALHGFAATRACAAIASVPPGANPSAPAAAPSRRRTGEP